MKSKEKERIHEIEELVKNMGFIGAEEGLSLYDFAKNGSGKGVIVEIGSFKGKSAIWLANGSKRVKREKVYSIDPHNIAGLLSQTKIGDVYIPKDSYNSFLKNIKKARVEDWIIPIKDFSYKVAEKWNKPIRLLFIDGSHEYEDVKRDFLLWEPFVSKRGIIAFHDTLGKNSEIYPGVKKFIEEYLMNSKEFKIIKIVDSIIFFQKKPNIFDLIKNKILINLWIIIKDFFKNFKSSLIRTYLRIDKTIGLIGISIKKNSPVLYNLFVKMRDKLYPSHPKPHSFFLGITSKCVLRCKQCYNWKNQEREDELTTGKKIELLKYILNWIKKPDKINFVSFYGGEPFLEKEELLRLANYCKENKINCLTNSNGYLIDEETAKQVAKSGLKVYISLDSTYPRLHNELRGKKDCYKRAVKAIDNLIKYCRNEKVEILSLLHKKNINELDKLIDFAKKKGIKISFQPIMCEGWIPEPDSLRLKEEYFPNDKKSIEKATLVLLKNLNDDRSSLDKCAITKERVSSYKKYFLTGNPGIKCNFDGSLIIDCFGNVKICFFSKPIGNIRYNTLKEIWNSKKARDMRKRLKSCRRNCSILLCQKI